MSAFFSGFGLGLVLAAAAFCGGVYFGLVVSAILNLDEAS